MKKKLQVSFSGGRTSAYMSYWLKKNMSHVYDMKFVFANTGAEHPDTLRFVNEVDKRFGLDLNWVEAVVHDGRKSCTHKLVDYRSAARNGEPFEAVVAKYGLPNRTFRLCTRELKANPMRSFMRSIGWADAEIAIGIRTDEVRRVSPTAAQQKFIYPLVFMHPTDKQDVLAFFEDFDWDLKIKEYEGNCRACFQKSDKKLNTLYRETPEVFDFPVRLDQLYSSVGPNNVDGPRKMYRGRRSTSELLAQFEIADMDSKAMFSDMDGGCSESCEPFENLELF